MATTPNYGWPLPEDRDKLLALFLKERLLDIDDVIAGLTPPGAGGFTASGRVTLVDGAATVSTASIGALSIVLLTGQDDNVVGHLRVSARVVATSFTVTSSEGTDSGVVGWGIV